MQNIFERFNDSELLTKEKIIRTLELSVQRIKNHMHEFENNVPLEASKDNFFYPETAPMSWTEGFYIGILWLCYEYSGDADFKRLAEKHITSFKNRIETKFVVNHHDMGFLYTLSCCAAYKLTGNAEAKDAALKAADVLVSRFQTKGEFFQAWGDIGTEENYRLIIDCLMNLPILYWATEVTGDSKYRELAQKHLRTTLNVALREDGSTYHTYFFSTKTGEPLCGKTAQGYSDSSAWARGQAWGVYGLAVNYMYLKDISLKEPWHKVTDYFLDNLPKDKIAYWDLCFQDGNEPRDSSSNAIAVCGILEAYRNGMCDTRYYNAALSMMNALIDKCFDSDITSATNGLLMHSTYAITNGADECCIWGDYFFMEALVRLIREWRTYW